jgi:hypothetical protein
MPDSRRARRQRQHSGRQQRPAEQGIHQAALAPLRLSGDKCAQAPAGQAVAQTGYRFPVLRRAVREQLVQRHGRRIRLIKFIHTASYLP